VASYKILVLDDNGFNRQVLKDILDGAGFDADTVGDLESFETALTWWKPTCVVVDVYLPPKNGVDVVRRVRGDFPDMGVVLMSAMPRDSLVRLAAECEADDCFSTLEGYTGVVDCLYAVYQRRGTP
jgi:CheY-like chemotaxis protein